MKKIQKNELIKKIINIQIFQINNNFHERLFNIIITNLYLNFNI